MYHNNETNHRTKDCPIYLDTKRKMDQEFTQPSPQLPSREVNHTMQWAPHNQQHSPSDPLNYPTQACQNSQTQPLAYYQSYHYVSTNHPQHSPIPQLAYHPTVPQITYPTHVTPTPTKSKLKPIHPHFHLRHKFKNLRNNLRTFPPMVPYSQSPEVQTQTSNQKAKPRLLSLSQPCRCQMSHHPN
jgi:hypothetical protein